MDARELTREYNRLSDKMNEAEKQLSYQSQEIEKLRMLLEDLRIDVAMIQKGR